MRFSDIAGHREAKNLLRSMADSGKIPHAILLSGPPGIGKLALARAFAQYIHCSHPTPDGDSCGNCPECRQHRSLNFPDMHYVYPVCGSKGGSQMISSDYSAQWREFLTDFPLNPFREWAEKIKGDSGSPAIKVDEARDVIRLMSLSNYSAEKKVVVIWLPEKMNPEAANHLLKVIEEPPAGSVFILVSDAPNELLSTIYSRTQRINLKPLPEAEIDQWLRRTLNVNSEDAALIARNSGGSLAKARAAVEQGTENREFFDLFTSLMRSAWKRDIGALRDWSDRIAALKRDKARRFLEYAASLVRESFIIHQGDDRLQTGMREEREFCRRFSPFVNHRNIERIMAETDDAARLVAGNTNIRLTAFDLALQLIIQLRK